MFHLCYRWRGNPTFLVICSIVYSWKFFTDRTLFCSYFSLLRMIWNSNRSSSLEMVRFGWNFRCINGTKPLFLNSFNTRTFFLIYWVNFVTLLSWTFFTSGRELPRVLFFIFSGSDEESTRRVVPRTPLVPHCSVSRCLVHVRTHPGRGEWERKSGVLGGRTDSGLSGHPLLLSRTRLGVPGVTTRGSVVIGKVFL